MNVKDAVALMAKNPAVGFPWEGALVSLINGFLPPESQLDPLTAEAKEILDAIETFEPSVKEMIYGSSLGNVNVVSPSPPVAVLAPSVGPMNPTAYHQLMLGAVGAVVATAAVGMAMNGAAAGDVIELLKLLASLVTGT